MILVSTIGTTLLPLPSMTYSGNFQYEGEQNTCRPSKSGDLGPPIKRAESLLLLLPGPRQTVSIGYQSSGPKLPQERAPVPNGQHSCGIRS